MSPTGLPSLSLQEAGGWRWVIREIQITWTVYSSCWPLSVTLNKILSSNLDPIWERLKLNGTVAIEGEVYCNLGLIFILLAIISIDYNEIVFTRVQTKSRNMSSQTVSQASSLTKPLYLEVKLKVSVSKSLVLTPHRTGKLCVHRYCKHGPSLTVKLWEMFKTYRFGNKNIRQLMLLALTSF